MNSSPGEKAIWETIRDSILTLYGSKGLSLIDPNLIEYNEETKNGIIRCTHDTERFLRASLASIMNVSERTSCLQGPEDQRNHQGTPKEGGYREAEKRSG